MAGVMFDENGPREWRPDCTEKFVPYTASHGNAAESRLARSRVTPYVSTAISPNGKVVAAATLTKVRIYCSRSVASTSAQGFGVCKTLDIKFVSKKEEIRAVALSDRLLAVLTYNRLIVYECEASGNAMPTAVVDETIDEDGKWTPKSLSISQNGEGREFSTSSYIWAWIAVGGDGVNGVKLFNLIQGRHWILQRNDLPVLKCRQNTGLMKIVGFSPNQSSSPYASIVVGVTTSNDVYFWDLRQSVPGRQTRKPTWFIAGSSEPNVPVSYSESYFWKVTKQRPY
jgi:hypothetical protein